VFAISINVIISLDPVEHVRISKQVYNENIVWLREWLPVRNPKVKKEKEMCNV